jgi:DNA-binding transcriptional MocR family regulator
MGLDIKLDRQGRKSLFLQIAEQIINDINLGVIKQGTRLPAERKLAISLSVNRSTVINAYNELTDRGYVQSHIGSGTTVANVNIEKEKEDIFVWRELLSGQAESLINPYNSTLKELLSQRNLIAMDAGIADPDHYPKKALADISQEILLSEGNMLLQHNSPQGLLSLRESLVSIMKSRGIHSQAENVIVLNGSQQGLDLVSRILLEPGDSIILEEPSFLGAIDTFRTYGVRLVGIPTDSEGMVTDYLEKAIKRTKPKFIYTIPTYHNPTGLSLSTTRR